MKDKYVDDQYGFWHEFGSSGAGVDIRSSDDRMDIGPIPKSIADTLIAEHNRVQNRLVELAKAFNAAAPEAFEKFWYEN